jgi:hypothetical protein
MRQKRPICAARGVRWRVCVRRFVICCSILLVVPSFVLVLKRRISIDRWRRSKKLNVASSESSFN